MKIKATDPDLSTIYSRIKDESLDLQPDFQRAEVWRIPKKKLLIDTILRDWQVPPVHVVLNEDSMVQEVLDGQQRLSAIRDFMDDRFRVDGRIEPFDDDLNDLNGMFYSQLPNKVRNRFDRYAIRVFEILEYNQGEPGELFNRLNESLKLTSAEKRNAYVGALRTQIKSLVDELDINDIDKRFLGFSNQRMAYHDLFIKLCYMLEAGSVTASFTEKQLNDRAREDRPFATTIVSAVKTAIKVIGAAKEELDEAGKIIHVTKASINSWLFFIAYQKLTTRKFEENSLIEAFVSFEADRAYYRTLNKAPRRSYSLGYEVVNELFSIFGIRSTSRVTTVSSLVIRDSIISLFYYMYQSDSLNEFNSSKKSSMKTLIESLAVSDKPVVVVVEEFADDVVWEAAL